MDKQLKIIHIEDNAADADLIARALRKNGFNFSTKIVESKDEFILALDKFNPDLILSDHSLPQFDSMEALKIYKEKKCTIPFILITGSVSEEFAIKSIKEGADDYILKNNLIRLPSAIEQALKARQIEQEKHDASLQLEMTNKELNTFIYKATHELRGPLCSIMGLINVAGMKGQENLLADCIQKISEGTNKLDAVLLSLTNVMTIRDARPILKEIDFKSLINSILDRLRVLENTASIEFNIKVDIQKGFFSDETIISFILMNIIENSIRYQSASVKKPFVDITIAGVENGIIMSVKDNGIGMEKKIHNQIFEMYFRGGQYSKGSGLGLYIVKNGVKKLGGSVDVKSELDQGSTFSVFLPTQLVIM